MPYQAAAVRAITEWCHQRGVEVAYDPGWETRGSEMFAPAGLTVHHDGASRNVRPIIRNGHGSLPGPLANWYLERPALLVVIAAGRANHAGRGGYKGLTSNARTYGLEIANDGVGERYPDDQLHAVEVLGAAVCQVHKLDPEMVHAHFEWAPDRKTDPSGPPWGSPWAMNHLRNRVRHHLTPQEDDDMTPAQDQRLTAIHATVLRLEERVTAVERHAQHLSNVRVPETQRLIRYVARKVGGVLTKRSDGTFDVDDA